MLAMMLGGQLMLLMSTPSFASIHDNCTSAQLPSTQELNARVKSNLAIGAVIPGTEAQQLFTIDCHSDWSLSHRGTSCLGGPHWAFGQAGGRLIRESSTPGVFTFSGMPDSLGYQFLDANGRPLLLDSENRHNTGVQIKTGLQNVATSFRLVKLSNAPLNESSLLIAMLLSCNDNEWSNQNLSGSQVTMRINIEKIIETCRMVTPSVQVVLPTVSHAAFNGVGSAVGRTPFSLDFQCDADAVARARISDATVLSNASDVLTLQGGSTADGVGVRLSHQGRAVALSPNAMFNQQGSEFLLTSPGSAQTIRLPLSAEYVQTNSRIMPGTVKALAVVTLDYD